MKEIVPLEKLVLPSSLNGEFGINRLNDNSLIAANNDIEAIDQWLLGAASIKTEITYRREAERLILWAVIERDKPLSSLNREDLFAYRMFMQDPPEQWRGNKHNKDHPKWRPFLNERLSLRSVRHAEVVLRQLFNFLVENRYLINNPYKSIKSIKLPYNNYNIDTQRSLSQAEWLFLKKFLDSKERFFRRSMDDSPSAMKAYKKWVRFRVVIYFLYLTGLRIHELADAEFSHLIDKPSVEGRSRFWLMVIGKDNKGREVPIDTALYEMLENMIFLFWELNLFECAPKWRIIPLLQNRERSSLSVASVHYILKEGLKIVVTENLEVNPKFVDRISQVSAHWMRHTHGSHAAKKNVPLSIIRDNLGHVSLTTTSQYIQAESDERFDQMKKLLKDE